jgi:hypothetical protein
MSDLIVALPAGNEGRFGESHLRVLGVVSSQQESVNPTEASYHQFPRHADEPVSFVKLPCFAHECPGEPDVGYSLRSPVAH